MNGARRIGVAGKHGVISVSHIFTLTGRQRGDGALRKDRGCCEAGFARAACSAQKDALVLYQHSGCTRHEAGGYDCGRLRRPALNDPPEPALSRSLTCRMASVACAPYV
jgi:hypothetical protein